MLPKIKKLFSFLVLLFFSFLGLFIPLKPALAVWDWLVGAITVIPAVTVAFILLLTGMIAALLAAFSGVVLNWVISGDSFTKLSYTNPANNDIIRVGLGITQGFVNMLLVLVLVYIAIATILRLAGYETKKLLVLFIIIALLVNFSPVICGLIVDASNIIMNFFLSEITGGKNLINQFRTAWKTYTGDVNFNWKMFRATEQADIVVQLALVTVLNLVLFFILLLFACVFAARYIVIWILVILSPLAFVCYILPITRKFWSLWWQQFFAWSFIGVTCGFFLYLADLLTTIDLRQNPPPGELGSAILPHLVPIGFLIIGLVFGLKTSAMGASAVMSMGTRSQKWVGGKIRKGIALGDRKIVPRIPPKDEEGKRNWKSFGSYFGTSRQVAKQITRTWEGIPVARWFRPEPLRKFSESRSAIEERKKEITGPSDTVIERVDRGVYKGALAAAAVDSIIRERGDSNDIIKYYMKKYNAKSDKELLENEDFLKDKNLVKAIEFIADAGNRGKVDRIDPRLAKIGRSKEVGRKKMIEAIINAKPSDVAMMEREVPENEEVMEVALATGDDDFFRALGRLKGKVQARQRTTDKRFSEWVDENKLDPTENKKNWESFMQYLSKKYNVLTPGIKKALTNERFQSAGWGYIKELGSGARYLTKEEREKQEEFQAKAGLQTAKGKGPSEGLRGLGEVKKEEGLKGLEDVKKEKKGKK